MILILGPYIGDFETECILFRPYSCWLCNALDADKIYLGTHSNRMFMYYDFLPKENVLPVFENISRDELGQVGYIHNSVSQKDYQIFIKNMRETIQEREECSRKDMKFFSLSYIKSTPVVSIYKKLFSSVKYFDVKNVYAGKVVYIPDNSIKKELHTKIYKFLKEYDVVVIGDKHTRMHKCNVVIPQFDYYENGYKLIFKIISEAKAVICPVSFWTTICNQQEVPVFSWGESVVQHKPGGIYHLGNDKSMVIWSDNIPFDMIKHFLERINNAAL